MKKATNQRPVRRAPNKALKTAISAAGLKIGYIENQAGMPENTLYNHINQGRRIADHHQIALKKVLRKHKINLAV